MTPKTAPPSRIAFIRARWHSEIVDRAFDGFAARAAVLMPHVPVEAFDVPGAFEMPLAAKKLALSGRYGAVVAAAFVVNGGIYRHEFVSEAVVSGLMQVGLETGVPCLSVSLTPHNFQPVPELVTFFGEHFVKKGAEAAEAVHQMHAFSRKLAAATGEAGTEAGMKAA
ncbi:6,7-dimethyl-8-ribityllumazine synthase [Pseudogemmobacter sonorensis]|uniref:6,7-dimethyl-8-ribityllumazine synthase n=1 Tax=Pseudogemmobacter sonorensis TaxID=2989681 RepID=UPI0036762703